VATPQLDRLAASGLRYNRFHVNALCSPTRAALLSGRNDHQVGFGTVADSASGYPGYNARWGHEYASVARVLQLNGYSTAAFGKWHNTPFDEINPVGPFDHWPTSLGFDYYYGFMAGMDNQWQPRLYRNTLAVEPSSRPEDGYHFTTDITNDAIRWLHQHDAVAHEKPFFLYYATGATHTPHHVPQVWIAQFKGKFDQGWDKLREETFARQKALGVIPANAELTPRPKELPAWDSLGKEEQKLLARQAEVYAAFLAHTDFEVGRLLGAVQEEGIRDNTLVFYIVGDNGASGEGTLVGTDLRNTDGKPASIERRLERIDDLGGELFSNHYAAAWAWALDAPFQWTKQVASHLGGTRDPLIVSWPGHIKDAGGLRSQFHHVNDIAPTIYEVAGIRFPDVVDGVKQVPLEGTSLAYSFDHSEAAGTHHIQFFEMVGNRGIYKDGWWAGARHVLPWEAGIPNRADLPIGQHPWELYNLEADYSQAHDLAAQNPEKLKELVALFDSEAKRNNVYPLLPKRLPAPTPADGKTTFTYREGVTRVPVRSAPNLSSRSHTITAHVDIPASGAQGVILAEGGRFGGFSLYVKDGFAVYELNASGTLHQKLVSKAPLPVGKSLIAFEFIADQPTASTDPVPGRSLRSGIGRLTVNGQLAGESKFERFGGFSNETLDLGSDLGTPVSTDYVTPFAFTGSIERVDIVLP
jgi:arylsulfatase